MAFRRSAAVSLRVRTRALHQGTHFSKSTAERVMMSHGGVMKCVWRRRATARSAASDESHVAHGKLPGTGAASATDRKGLPEAAAKIAAELRVSADGT